jgi:Rad52/22 family double-strand break repair protein
MLNEANLATLAKPFTPAEHGTVQNNPYIRKSAIRNRLSKVDLLWELGAPEYVCTDGDVVMYRGSLTIGGVTRWGLGSGIITRKDSKGNPVEGFTLAKNIAKAHKSAATDVLARAATEFGVGNYLRDKPWEAVQMNFTDWLVKMTGEKPVGQSVLNAWADVGSVQHLLNRCAQGKGLSWADVSRLTGIVALEDYAAWNKRFTSITVAAEWIAAALDKELVALPPASPKQAAAVPG